MLEAKLEVEDRETLASSFYPNGRSGGLTVPGPPPGALGQQLLLRVQTRKPPRAFVLRGQIAWVRHKAGPHQPAGYGFDFSPEDDSTRIRLLAFARNEIPSKFTRVELRREVELPVRLEHDGIARKEWLADLSSRGAFVRTWNPLPVGARVHMKVKSGLLSSVTLDAQVAWVRLVGDHAGMGLEFIVPDDATSARLAKMLSALAK